jgi:hypothetical protein
VNVVIELVRRCAWCNRVWTADGWQELVEEEADRETATICPDCQERLKELGLSATG